MTIPTWRKAFPKRNAEDVDNTIPIKAKSLPNQIPIDLRTRLESVLSMRGAGAAEIYDEFKDWLSKQE